MRITETVERECCQFQDLKPYKGIGEPNNVSKFDKLVFCIHCGQIRSLGKEAREPSFPDFPDILYVPIQVGMSLNNKREK